MYSKVIYMYTCISSKNLHNSFFYFIPPFSEFMHGNVIANRVLMYENVFFFFLSLTCLLQIFCIDRDFYRSLRDVSAELSFIAWFDRGF